MVDNFETAMSEHWPVVNDLLIQFLVHTHTHTASVSDSFTLIIV